MLSTVPRLIAERSAQESKGRLRRQTEEAIAMGAFGVPTMFADGELFWGVDALPHFEDHLMGEDPIEGVMLERWAGLPASAQRKTR